MINLNPQLFQKFETNRIQPVKDLIARIDIDPKRIIDIGCGQGNSTMELKKRWPDAEIMALDHSPEMIEKAKNRDNNIEWVITNATDNLEKYGSFDLIFSNTALQWILKQAQMLLIFLTHLNMEVFYFNLNGYFLF